MLRWLIKDNPLPSLSCPSSATGESLYTFLGLPKTASQDEIKKAYRKVRTPICAKQIEEVLLDFNRILRRN